MAIHHDENNIIHLLTGYEKHRKFAVPEIAYIVRTKTLVIVGISGTTNLLLSQENCQGNPH